jgi:2-keto-3-deoxy-6-phosphogluconate aldolase
MSIGNSNRKQVDAALRRAGVVVVMNTDHVKSAGQAVTTMQAIYQAGYVAELTFRIDEGLVREAMQELTKLRAAAAAATPDKPFVLGVGSVINPRELKSAIDMGFDMIVAPANVMGGCGDGHDFIRIAHEADIFTAPAIFTPTELNYFLERSDGLESDALKIFPARSHGPEGIADLLAPFVRPRHAGKIIMPTGAVNMETGPRYHQAIAKRGFTPVLGMAAPLQLVIERKKPGDLDTINEALTAFRNTFKLPA